MAISTFTELKTAVDNWLARTDLAGRAPEFIALAEARMNREIGSKKTAFPKIELFRFTTFLSDLRGL